MVHEEQGEFPLSVGRAAVGPPEVVFPRSVEGESISRCLRDVRELIRLAKPRLTRAVSVSGAAPAGAPFLGLLLHSQGSKQRWEGPCSGKKLIKWSNCSSFATPGEVPGNTVLAERGTAMNKGGCHRQLPPPPSPIQTLAFARRPSVGISQGAGVRPRLREHVLFIQPSASAFWKRNCLPSPFHYSVFGKGPRVSEEAGRWESLWMWVAAFREQLWSL